MTRKPSIVAAARSLGVELTQRGTEYIGRCPIHEDKTPSFSVNPEKQVFHCFGCGAAGDVFDLVMKARGLSFPEAKRFLGVTGDDRRQPDRQTELVRAFRRWCWDRHAYLVNLRAAYRWAIGNIETEGDLDLVADAGIFDELPEIEHEAEVLFSGTEGEKLAFYRRGETGRINERRTD